MGLKLIIYPVMFIACLAIIFMLIVPTYNDAKRIRDEDVAKAQVILDEEKEITENIQSLMDSYDNNESDLQKISYALPVEEDTKSFLIQLEAIFLQNEIFYEVIDVDSTGGDLGGQSMATDPTQPGMNLDFNPNRISVKLSLRGSYENFIKAMEDLEKLNRLNNVVDVSFNLSEGGEGDVSSEATEEGESVQTENADTVTWLDGEIGLEIYQQDKLDAQTVKKAFEAYWQTKENTSVAGDGTGLEEGGGAVPE